MVITDDANEDHDGGDIWQSNLRDSVSGSLLIWIHTRRLMNRFSVSMILYITPASYDVNTIGHPTVQQ